MTAVVVGSLQISDADRYALNRALAHNCNCTPNPPEGTPRCSAHRMLLEPSTLRHLLYGRALCATLLTEEFAGDWRRGQ